MPPHPRPSTAAVALATLAASCVAPAPDPASPEPARHVFVSTHDGHVRVLALRDGRLGETVTDVAVGEPVGFLTFHPTAPVLYALGHTALFALAYDRASGALTPLGRGTVGVRGTHVAVHPSGSCALVASYGEHAVAALPLDTAGVPRDVAAKLGGDERGGLRRAHQVRVHAASGAVHVPCLGEDHVAQLAVSADGRALTRVAVARTPSGAGPRHMDFAPGAPLAFVLNELAGSITTFRVDPTGGLTPSATVSTLPSGSDEPSGRSSDVHVAPDARHLYAINREPFDDIVTFRIAADGGLREVARTPTGGVHARTFALDPTGRHLWVGNTKSRSITTFVAHADGSLEPLGEPWLAPADVSCVLAR